MFLIVTGSSLMPSTQDPSQGAGHRRPVKSGKLFVACSRSIAARQRSPVDQIVPVRNLVAERTALMAERNAAIHAARSLVAHLFLGRRQIDLVPVAKRIVDRSRVRLGPLDLDETRWCYPLAAPTSSANAASRFSAFARASASSTRL